MKLHDKDFTNNKKTMKHIYNNLFLYNNIFKKIRIIISVLKTLGVYQITLPD